jgi:hypothetical protein
MIMTRILIVCFAIAAVAMCAIAQGKKATAPAKKLEVKDLPPAVQKTVQAEMKDAHAFNVGQIRDPSCALELA